MNDPEKFIPVAVTGALIGLAADWIPRFLQDPATCPAGQVPTFASEFAQDFEDVEDFLTGWIPIVGTAESASVYIENEFNLKRAVIPMVAGTVVLTATAITQRPITLPVLGVVAYGVANAYVINPGSAQQPPLDCVNPEDTWFGCGGALGWCNGVWYGYNSCDQDPTQEGCIGYVGLDKNSPAFDVAVEEMCTQSVDYYEDQNAYLYEQYPNGTSLEKEMYTSMIGDNNICIKYQSSLAPITNSNTPAPYKAIPGAPCTYSQKDENGNSVYSTGTSVAKLVKQQYNYNNVPWKYSCCKSDGMAVTSSNPNGTWQEVVKDSMGVCYVPGAKPNATNYCSW